MTVHVQTAEHGKKSYPHADDYIADPEFGYLELVSKEEGLVATYPPGAWVGVAIEIPETKDEEVVDAELVSRVWEASADIPSGVSVRDADGDTYRFNYDRVWEIYGRDEWQTSSFTTDSERDLFAPFTEVIA